MHPLYIQKVHFQPVSKNHFLRLKDLQSTLKKCTKINRKVQVKNCQEKLFDFVVINPMFWGT